MNIVQKSRKLVTAVLAAATLSSIMFLVGVPRARAENERREEAIKCHRRIERAEERLDDAVRHHGRNSHQALARRRDLNAQRERCWNEYHGWWNGREHQWHKERDWDRDRD
ncbi:MAG: hypothetical protein QOD84_939 [Acidobacteriaceae bacterium]|jgi:hypothetical protein